MLFIVTPQAWTGFNHLKTEISPGVMDDGVSDGQLRNKRG